MTNKEIILEALITHRMDMQMLAGEKPTDENIKMKDAVADLILKIKLGEVKIGE